MYLGLIQNTALLVALSTLYNLVSRLRGRQKVSFHLTAGILFGAVSVTGMMIPFRYGPGVIYDGRSVVHSIAGLFGGLPVACISAALAGVYRASLGGAGVWAGLATILGCSLVGLVFRRAANHRPENLELPALYFFGVTAHLVMLGCQLLILPWPAGVKALGAVWLPVLTIYPVATVLMGYLLGDADRRWHNDRRLAESRDLLAKSQTIAKVGSWELDRANNRFRWSDETHRIFGLPAGQFDGTCQAFLQCVHPDDRAEVDAAYRRSIDEKRDGYGIEHRIVRPDTGEIRIVYQKCEHQRNAAGVVVRSIGFVQDITERKQSEAALRQSEALFRNLFQKHAAIKLLIDSADGRILDANEAAAAFYGWPQDELCRMKISDIIPLPLEQVKAAVEHALTRRQARLEFRNRRADGSVREVATYLSEFESGERVLWHSIIHDITDRKRAEAVLRESEARFRQLAETIHEVFWMRDAATNQLLYVSPAYEAIWGRTCPSLHQNLAEWFEAVHPADRERLQRAWDTRRTSGGYDEEYRILRPDGAVRWIHDKAFPVYDEAGATRRVVGVAEDVTERKELQAQLLRSQRLEAIGTLAGGIAHDFNNALAPILMGVELLRVQYPEEDKILKTIQSCAQRGADMIRQLLSFAKGAEGARVAVNLNHVVKDLQRIAESTFPKNIRTVVTCDPHLPFVLGDPTQLHQVLLNLCVNARDAMPNGGTLTLETLRENLDAASAKAIPGAPPGHYVVLRVQDTGHGIPPEILDRIFEPFFTTKGARQGTGLGLATVQSITNGHGGFLHVESKPGSGSTFSVYLPAAGQEHPAGPLPHTPSEFRGNGETILFVDDEVPVREIARAVLRRLNFAPLTATDGADALQQLARHRTDLRAIITDLHMPRMDGLALVRSVRRTFPEVPILVTSGRLDDAVAGELKTLGVTHCLDKPFTESQLAGALKSLLAVAATPQPAPASPQPPSV